MSPPNLIRSIATALALAVAPTASDAAGAGCDARRQVASVEDALKAAAIMSDGKMRGDFLATAIERIEELDAESARMGTGGALAAYVDARRRDIATLSNDPRARDLTNSLQIDTVISGAATPDCSKEAAEEPSDGRAAPEGGDKAEKNKRKPGQQTKTAAQEAGGADDGEEEARTAEAQSDRPPARSLAELVKGAKVPREFLWLLAFIPLGAVGYRVALVMNRRRTVRYICCIPAELRVDDVVLPIKIFDFSRLGAKLSVEGDVDRWEDRRLEMLFADMAVRASVKWSAQRIIGVSFDEPLDSDELGALFEIASQGAGVHRV